MMDCPLRGCHKEMREEADRYVCDCGFVLMKCPKMRGKVGV